MTAARPITPLDLWKIRRVGSPAPAPDGSFVIVPVASYDIEANEGKERLYRLSSGGGEPEPLTSPDVSSSQPSVSPDGAMVAFVRKPPPPSGESPRAPGWDKPQPHVLPLAGGEAVRATQVLFPMGASDPRWFPDGRRLCVIAPVLSKHMTLEETSTQCEAKQKDPVKAHVTEDRVYRFWDQWLTDGAVPHLFEIDITTGTVRDLTPDSDRWFDFMEDSGQYDIAPDGHEIVFSANASRAPHHKLRWALWSVPVAGGPVACLTADNPADDVRPRYSPDGRYILYGARRDPEVYCDRVRLTRYDRASREHLILTESWDLSPGEWEFVDGQSVAVLTEERARGALYRMDIGGPGKPELCVREGTLQSVRPAGRSSRAVLATHNSLLHPPEVVRVALEPSSKIERLSRFNDALLSEVELGEVVELEFMGADEEPCQAFVLWPKGTRTAAGEPRVPLLHLIHGGPYGVFGDTWHFRWNAAVLGGNRCAVAMVNFHGSSSFGDGWARSILADWGGKPATDILRATDALIETGRVDPDRVAIAGGSYGGYMTCWLASQTPRFACAIAHAAVFDLPSLYAGDITQGFEREFGAEPWGGTEARAVLDRHNPSSFIANYKTPMLVLHGEKDYRVPATHALHLYGVLKARGVEARLVYYPDENHWILKPKNSLHWYGEVQAWLARWLGG